VDKEAFMRCLLRPETVSCGRTFVAVEHYNGQITTLADLSQITGLTVDRTQRQLATLRRLGFVQVTRLQYGIRVHTSVPVGTPLLPAAPAAESGPAPALVTPPLAPADDGPAARVAREIARQRGQQVLSAAASPGLLPDTGAAASPSLSLAAPPIPAPPSQPSLSPELAEPEAVHVEAQRRILNECDITKDCVSDKSLRLQAMRYGDKLNIRQVALEFTNWLTGNTKSATRKRREIERLSKDFDWDTCYSNHVKGCVEKVTGERQFVKARRFGPRADDGPTHNNSAPSTSPEPSADEFSSQEMDAAWLELSPEQRDVLLQFVRDDQARAWGANSPRLAKLNFAKLARIEAARNRKRNATAAL
jgi:hypothetical protein